MKAATPHPDSASPPSRRAKIVCTVGPASSTEGALRELMRCGMDVARLNFSHGTHEDHARSIDRLRKAAAKEGRTVCILQDLQGPKIRTGRLRDRRPVVLKQGSRVTITPRNVLGTATLLPTSFRTLAQEVEAGARILISDGLIELGVRAIHGDEVECEVVNGGMMGEHQGINLPGTALSVPSLTEKDLKDLEFGLRHDVDIMALSFVRTAADVREAKRVIGGRNDLPVIAKLEKPQAIERLEEILEAADGVMVARGDLGVEMAPEQVPVIQKHIIQRAAAWRKPVITATQMLESMVEHPRPTRAEASDVANAVFDGTDALMLSAETATGRYPAQAVSMMARIIVEAEMHMRETAARRRRHELPHELTIAETICESVAHAADELDMRAVAVYTETGNTARLVSMYRPKAAIYGFAHREGVCNRLNLLWGVYPVRSELARTGEDMAANSEEYLTRAGAVQRGDVMAVLSGTRGSAGSTNMMRLRVVGNSECPERRRAPRAHIEEEHKR